jgi:hypothetical protein
VGSAIDNANLRISAIKDQLRTANGTEYIPLASRRSVVGLAARLGANTRVHDTTALWAVAHGRLRPFMIQILT